MIDNPGVCERAVRWEAPLLLGKRKILSWEIYENVENIKKKLDSTPICAGAIRLVIKTNQQFVTC